LAAACSADGPEHATPTDDAGPGGSGMEAPGGAGGVTSSDGGSTGSGGASSGTGGASTGGAGGASIGGSGGTGGSQPEPPAPDCDGIGAAADALGTTPGDASLPFPTLSHLSVVWEIDGDTNDDGKVAVRVRPEGGTWREGTPLRRVPAGANEGLSWSNKHAGSLFGLQAGTRYDVELHLEDPDGGCETRTLTATTRSVPAAASGARVIAVTPGSFSSAAGAAAAGDVLELSAGTYGGFTFGRDGTAVAPIVIRGSGNVTIDGDVRLDGRSHVIVESVTVNGQIKFNGGVGVAVNRCTVNANVDGIAMLTRGENAYIADNVVTGKTQWTEAALGVDGDNIGEGIVVTGPGHVIEHNRVTGFRDAISFLEDDGADDQLSLDVIGNDIYEAADDGIEADFCFHDCRIVGNRLTNVFMAVSSQPGLGGPTYFVRNAMYNVILSAFKLQRGSVGDVVWHNTVVKNGDALGIYTSDVFSRQQFRNNLFLGGPGGEYGGWSSGNGNVVSLAAADTTVDLDYDGYGSTLGTFDGRIGDTRLSSLVEMRSTTSEVHAVEVSLAAFAAAVPYPSSPFPALAAQDLRPSAAGAAVDAGVAIAGINDGFAGSAPDLGAHEAGQPLPVYGPR
jgi:hypothetical protein